MGDTVAGSVTERARIEQSYHAAFKALEALLGGEQSRDPARVRARFQAAGVNIDEPFVPFPNYPVEQVEDVFLYISKTRDRRAAHGGGTSPDRRITYRELLEVQTFAMAVSKDAIENAART
jgi:hypothetical protein